MWISRVITGFSVACVISLSLSANDLPPLQNPDLKHFGYYYADGASDGANRDFLHEIERFANLYVAIPRAYLPQTTWQPSLFAASLTRAVQLDFDILLVWDDDAVVRAGVMHQLRAVPGAWDRVRYITVLHEALVSRAVAEARIDDVRRLLAASGLDHTGKRFGIEFQRCQAQGLVREGGLLDLCGAPDNSVDDSRFAFNAHYVAIQAFLDAQGSPDSAVNQAALNRLIDTARQRIPSSKDIIIIGQAYDRNGLWTNGLGGGVNVQTLKDLQRIYYLQSYWPSSRVVAIAMFSYGRDSAESRVGGTRLHRALLEPHVFIANRIVGE